MTLLSIVSNAAPTSATWAAFHSLVDTHDAHGTLAIGTPQRGLVYVRSTGILSEALAAQWIEVAEELWSRPVRWVFFCDWEQLRGYDTRARTALTRVVVDHRANVRAAHFLTSSRLVAMGVATAGAATGVVGVPLTATTNRDEWLRELARHANG